MDTQATPYSTGTEGGSDTTGARSVISTMIGIFGSPTIAFRSLATHPRWVLPFILSVFITMTTSFVLVNAAGLENVVRMHMKPSEQMEKVAETAERYKESKLLRAAMGVLPAIATTLLTLTAAILFFLAFTLVGSSLNFKQSLAVVSHAFFAYFSVTSTVNLLMLLLKEESDLMRPLASSLGWFLDPTHTNRIIYHFASSLDAFIIWTLFLLFIGFTTICPRITRYKALAVISTVWFVAILSSVVLLP